MFTAYELNSLNLISLINQQSILTTYRISLEYKCRCRECRVASRPRSGEWPSTYPWRYQHCLGPLLFSGWKFVPFCDGSGVKRILVTVYYIWSYMHTFIVCKMCPGSSLFKVNIKYICKSNIQYINMFMIKIR